ncbi:ferrochelatase [Gemella sp. zg-570]|uniref:ferrochelatase n=1 Tax=Gemella sp. zg-570 TaxID=2840371 RepID=UPI001C0C1722|nr:ferrochelatase [Gemella sp. zg-570]QWQ38858.1 ferrochelatase [Gemella sp. zg-570]
MKKTAILVMTYGSPEDYSFEGIAKFFTNIRRGKRPKDEEIQHLYENYKKINKSPLQKISQETVRLLRERIGATYNIYFANKFSAPYITDAIKKMEDEGVEKCICLILEPHYSIYSIMGYEKFLESKKIKFNLIKDWYKSEALTTYWVAEIQKIITAINSDDYKVIFTAHSVPTIALDYGDPYIEQIKDNINILAQRLNLKKENYTNAWQSESDIGIPWIKPDVLEYLRSQEEHKKNYIFVPISFISDHIETLFDNDIECKEICDELAINYYRPKSPNYDERLIDALVETIDLHKDKDFIFLNGEEGTFNEMSSPDEKDDLKMPDFVKKTHSQKRKRKC